METSLIAVGAETTAGSQPPPPQQQRIINSEPKFPARLHYLLGDLAKDGHADIVSWAIHGRSFKVHKPKLFVELVLCRWFRQSKLASFHRQLNIYGFQRITSGPDKDGYYHDKFLRGQPALADEIPRISIKGKGHRASQGGAAASTEPNFYTMPYLDDPVLVDDQPVVKHPVPTERRDESRLVSTAAASSELGMYHNPLPTSAFNPLLVNRDHLGWPLGACDMTEMVSGSMPRRLAAIPSGLAFGTTSSPVNVSLALVQQAVAQRRNNAAYAMYRERIAAEYLNRNQHALAPLGDQQRRRSDLVFLLAAALGDNANNPYMR